MFDVIGFQVIQSFHHLISLKVMCNQQLSFIYFVLPISVLFFLLFLCFVFILYWCTWSFFFYKKMKHVSKHFFFLHVLGFLQALGSLVLSNTQITAYKTIPSQEHCWRSSCSTITDLFIYFFFTLLVLYSRCYSSESPKYERLFTMPIFVWDMWKENIILFMKVYCIVKKV